MQKYFTDNKIKAKYNIDFNRWKLTFAGVLLLSNEFPVKIIFVKYDIINSNESIEQINKIHEYIQIDRLSVVNQVKFADQSIFDYLKAELKTSIDLKQIDYVLIKNGQVSNSDSLTFPFLKEFKSVNDQSISVKLETSNSSSRFELTEKLAYFLGSNSKNLLVSPTKIYFMPFEISTINYALIYTDIIQEQYFGDKLTNILKMIPLKTSIDNEVVTFFDNLHYVPLCKNNFSSINLEIRDIYGELI